ncbi:MAG: SGNH/GDSL hydrolase family protein [Gammaproteobacteria bacterium]
MKIYRLLFLSLFAILFITSCASSSDDNDIKESPANTLPAVNYVALGASDAFGIGAEPITRGYVYRIKDGFEDRGRKVNLLNLGIPTADIPAIKKTAKAALKRDTEIDLVTIWTGANDLIGGSNVSDFEEDLESMLRRIRNKSNAFIVIMNLPDLTQIKKFREDPDKDVTEANVTAFNQAITRQANNYNVPIVDFFKDAPSDMLVSKRDGFHPNNDGHQRIADLYLQIILPKFGL